VTTAPERSVIPLRNGIQAQVAGWLGALGEAPFRLLFLARSSSQLGDYVAQIAVAFAVLDLNGSAGDLGLVMAARTAPIILLTAVAGVWADRLPRQRVMLSADVLCGLAQATLGVLVLAGSAALWHFLVLQALVGIGLAFFRPAATGVTPSTVSPARLQQANGLIFLSMNVTSMLGPAVGGALVAGLGSGTAIAVDAATFAVSACFLLAMRVKRVPRPAAREGFLRELASGWHEVSSRRWLWTGILYFAALQVTVFGVFFILGPAIADDHLGGAGAWAVIVSASGAGAIVGGIVSLRWRPRRPLAVCFALWSLWCVPLLALGLGASTVAIAATMVPAGFAFSLAGALWETTLQRHVPERALSRVSAYDWMGSTALRPLGFVLAGPLAAAFGAEAPLVGAAAVLAAASAATLAVTEIRTLRGSPSAAVMRP